MTRPDGAGDEKQVDDAVKEPMEEEDNGPSFFSLSTLKVAKVNMINGMLSGYSIGFVGPYSTLYDMSENCNAYYAKEPCETLANSHCTWDPTEADYFNSGRACVWSYQTRCTDFTLENECGGECEWSYADTKCHNKHGYSAINNGIFAGAMILGCIFGSGFGGPLETYLGLKRTFFVSGVMAIVGSVCNHIASQYSLFWLLCIGRVIVGFAMAVVSVASPMYVNMKAHPKHCKSIGVLFQVFNTLGICMAASMGLIVGQTVSYYSNRDVRIKARMQGFCAVSTLISLNVMLLGIFLDEGDDKNEDDKDEAQMLNQDEYSWGDMLVPLILAVFVSGALQLTGINAVMNYAPTIMETLGMDPLMGNFVVMVWNFVTTLVSIPLTKFVSIRNMFLGSCLVSSIACLLLCGIPVIPGVAAKNVKDGVAITGILVFIAAFEIGVGPCFYVLSQDVFPPSFRPKGASFTLVVEFFFNLIINVFYPYATKGISGGASGNQDKGQAAAFIFFGFCGFVCFTVLFFYLYPWEETHPVQGLEATPSQSSVGEEQPRET